MTDSISPSHYKQGEVECIDAIKSSLSREAFQGFLQGNIIKYVWRHKHKNRLEDLKKAQWYLSLLLMDEV